MISDFESKRSQLEKSIAGIVKIECANQTIYVYTKNVFIKISQLDTIRRAVGATDVEVNIRHDRRDGFIYEFQF